MKRTLTIPMLVCFILLTGLDIGSGGFAADLSDIQARGVLRHLGIPYANFVTGSGDGLEVETMQLFARHLGVRYEFVKTSFAEVIADLAGIKVAPRGEEAEMLGEAPIKGDVIATGFTVLPWRQKVVDYSVPTFPTQVWLVVRADSSLKPIVPSGSMARDIAQTKKLLRGRTCLAILKTCLDPSLYQLADTGAKIKLYNGNLNELVPALLNGEAETTILDVPTALLDLEKWAGKIKVIGPISEPQDMAAAFPKSAPHLREAFNRFFAQIKKDGTYNRLVKKYYPAVTAYFPKFFASR
ncbi:MAG: transporter substrate-binding domain-containing protein [Deltaproteobacteria bacterium]|nr:transporter substrate-binding domain-containing protein [Deltaproteobacteria bacterium]